MLERLKQRLDWFLVRTLKVDILTLFITLIIFTFTCVMLYSYFGNYSAIMEYSKGTMQRNSAVIIERISNLEREATEILKDTSGLFINQQNISVDDPQLQLSMLNMLKFHENLSSFFFAFESGNRVLVKTIRSSSQTTFMTKPNVLPAQAVYIVKTINVNKRPYPEIWYYKDASFKTIASEEFPHITIIGQQRPWYIGATQTKKIYWTDIYHYLHTHDFGLTASNPIYNKDNQFIGILGADISILDLENFLGKQSIGKSGRAFIVNDNGSIEVPQSEIFAHKKISPSIVSAAFLHYKKTNSRNFSFNFHHVKYLGFISTSPDILGKHWNIVTVVPFSDFFGKLIETQMKVILITLVILLFSILVIYYFSTRISKPIVTLAKELDKITHFNFSSKLRVLSHIIEIQKLDSSVATMRAAIYSFGRYVPKGIVKQLLAQGKEINLSVERRPISILFSDIQSFTSISETYSLNALMSQLNRYYDGLSKIIYENQGTIDKYIGDSIMAFWGAPAANPHHAVSACETVLQCHAFVRQFNKQCKQQGKSEFITRFGISSGMVLVGNIGTQERMNYTVIGDAVNTAERLQVTDKFYHVSIIISEAVLSATA